MSNFITFGQINGGLPGTAPSLFNASTPDALSVITTAGYMNDQAKRIKANDIVFINYLDTSTFPLDTGEAATFGEFQVTYNSGTGNWSLTQTDLSGFLLATNNLSDLSNPAAAAANLGVGTFTTTVTLTQAQVQAMSATPVQLLAAPGAGKVIQVLNAAIYTNFQTTAFAGGGVGIVQYGNTALGAGKDALAATIPAAEITASASQIYALNGNTGNALTAVTNLGIFLSNQTGAFTGGNSASTVVVTLTYQVLTATV